MAQTTLTIQMDADLAERFLDFCEDVGMSADSAVSAFAKMTTRKWALPFELTGDPRRLDHDSDDLD